MGQTLKQVMEQAEQLLSSPESRIAGQRLVEQALETVAQNDFPLPLAPHAKEPTNDVLRVIIELVTRLPDEQQWQLSARFLHALSEYLESVRPIYHSEEAFMRALGMSDERIARLLAEPVEPEPGEEYEHADL